MMGETPNTVLHTSEPSDRSLLIVDDDTVFANRLAQAMAERGFEVQTASSLYSGLEMLRAAPPRFAVFDLRLRDGNGIDLVEALKKLRRDARAIVLTGYGNIATAVSAAKFGATDFLAKPSDADQITAALLAAGTGQPPPPDVAAAPRDVRLAHIQGVLERCNNNLSEAARQLGMHRRTLQRIVRHEESRTEPANS
jgi:two-component system, response regulator RegA